MKTQKEPRRTQEKKGNSKRENPGEQEKNQKNLKNTWGRKLRTTQENTKDHLKTQENPGEQGEIPGGHRRTQENTGEYRKIQENTGELWKNPDNFGGPLGY